MSEKSKYILTEEPEGPEYPWCDLFQKRRYFKLHLTGNDRYFTLRREGEKEPVAAIHFSETEPGHFRSPARATYGGPAIAAGADEVMEPFLQMVCEKLRAEGATEINMVCAPSAHKPGQIKNLWNTLKTLGFELRENLSNHAISVDSADLITKMAHNNRKRLKKCEREEFQFACAAEKPHRRIIYDTIAANRRERGFDMSMSWEGAETMINEFPQNVEFYDVSASGRTIAGAICLILNPEILYTLFWGNLREFDSHSPVTMLAAGIYNRCRNGKIKLMDLGTSAAFGEENGLSLFKKRLGAEASEKRVYCVKF
ncbi:GNAT family N-acetyltransferase [Candidatus Mycalebacterium sp.]